MVAPSYENQLIYVVIEGLFSIVGFYFLFYLFFLLVDLLSTSISSTMIPSRPNSQLKLQYRFYIYQANFMATQSLGLSEPHVNLSYGLCVVYILFGGILDSFCSLRSSLHPWAVKLFMQVAQSVICIYLLFRCNFPARLSIKQTTEVFSYEIYHPFIWLSNVDCFIRVPD